MLLMGGEEAVAHAVQMILSGGKRVYAGLKLWRQSSLRSYSGQSITTTMMIYTKHMSSLKYVRSVLLLDALRYDR
jgi:hypothetical protein